MKKPFSLDINLAKLLKIESSLPHADIKAAEYLLKPATPVKSLMNFLAKLFQEVGKAAVRPKSGSFSVSVNL